MENENLQPVEKLTPFTRMIMTIGTLPSSFYASMSYYESMVWLYEYLKNEVIPTVNNNAEAVEELQEAFTTLKDYIDNYFDNLDVQEEINKKLDQMAIDGTLTNLIKDYVDPLYQAYESSINQKLEDQDNDIYLQNVEIDNFKNTVNGQIEQIDNKVSSATSGSPKGVYATVSDLQTADPNHDYIYLVTATGNWYYYNTSQTAWTSGGTYLSSDSDSFLLEDSVNSLENKVINRVAKTLQNTGISQSINFDNSTIKLKYKKIIPFYIQAGIYNNGISYNANAERGISNLLDIDGKLDIYNIGQINFDFLEINPSTNTIVRRLDNTFANSYYKTIECSSAYKYAIFIKNADNSTPINQTTINNANNTLLLCQEPITKEVMNDASQTNIFINPVNGGYIDYTDGNLVSNQNMCYTDYIQVNNREKLYLNPIYCQLAFYDMNKTYISGYYYNPIVSALNNINNIVDIPTNAIYMRASTRIGTKKDLIISENAITSLNKNYYFNNLITPKELVKDTSLKYYCNLNLQDHPNDDRLIKSSTGVSEVADGFSINNGWINYKKYIAPDNSITTFRFKCNEDSDFSVGLNCREFNAMTDAGLRIRIKTATKEMIIYSSDWYTNNIEKRHVYFNFELTNNAIYCLRINKKSIYDISIELFNAKTPNEVCSTELYTDKDATTVNTNNMARAWGSPMAMVNSGTVIFTHMEQLVSNNQYPKIAVFGDSYVENFSRPYNNSYVRLMKDILDDQLFISGAGGDNSSHILARMKNELLNTKPQYCIINTGVNDRYITQAQYENNMDDIIEILESLDITPILTTCPRVLDVDNIEVMTYINNYVRNSGYEYIDVAYALSTGDGYTQDSNKMNSDTIHPNNNGANAIIQYIKAYLPYLLIK